MNKKFKERTGFDLAKINKEVLAEWDSNNIEKRSITEREGHPQYTFYEGPPSANGHRVPLQDDERLLRAPQGRLGHTRTAR